MAKALKVIITILMLLLLMRAYIDGELNSHGPVLDESYRRGPRIAALDTWIKDRTMENLAAYDHELKVLGRYLRFRAIGTFIVFASAIYMIWKYQPPRGDE